MSKKISYPLKAIKNDRVVLQALGLFVLTNLLWSGHRPVADWIHLWWGTPAAHLVGMYFGHSPVFIDGSWVVPLAGSYIRVTSECDAFGFFSLVTAVSVVHVLGHYKARKIYKCLAVAAVVAAQYLLTILLNGLRIIGAYYVHAWVRELQLERFQSVFHLGIGVLVFLPALIAVLMYCEKELFYE